MFLNKFYFYKQLILSFVYFQLDYLSLFLIDFKSSLNIKDVNFCLSYNVANIFHEFFVFSFKVFNGIFYQTHILNCHTTDVLFLLWSQGNKLFLSKMIKIVVYIFLLFGFVFYI